MQPRTWIWMNNIYGIPVTSYYKRHGRRGCFAVDNHGNAAIFYNTAYPPDTQVRVLIHESAHAVIAADDPFPEHCFVANYDDPLADDRHRVCRRVEHIILRGCADDLGPSPRLRRINAQR